MVKFSQDSNVRLNNKPVKVESFVANRQLSRRRPDAVVSLHHDDRSTCHESFAVSVVDPVFRWKRLRQTFRLFAMVIHIDTVVDSCRTGCRWLGTGLWWGITHIAQNTNRSQVAHKSVVGK